MNLAFLIAIVAAPALSFAAQEELELGDQVFLAGDIDAGRSGQSGPLAASGFGVYRGRPWPAGELRLSFAEDISEERRELFLSVCRVFSRAANLRCVAARDGRFALRVQLGADGQCDSTVGYHEGGDRMNLGEGCWHPGVIAHELGHAVGLLHEHQRGSRVSGYDRDEFVEVLWDNIQDDDRARGAFVKLGSGLLAAEATPYDFESIMHYESWAFGRNGLPTLVAKTGSASAELGRGWCSYASCVLSELDRRHLAAIYGPPMETALDAEIVGIAMPDWAAAGETIPVQLEFANRGSEAWSPALGLSLGLRRLGAFEEDAALVPLGRLTLPGENAVFDAPLRAPLEAGRHAYRLQLFSPQTGWFGDPFDGSVWVDGAVAD